MEFEEEVEARLDELGDTAEKIAATLTQRGFQGERGCAHTCVLAEYLNREFPGWWFAVTGSSWQAHSTESRRASGWFRPEMAVFASDFDAGKYPQLVLEEETL